MTSDIFSELVHQKMVEERRWNNIGKILNYCSWVIGTWRFIILSSLYSWFGIFHNCKCRKGEGVENPLLTRRHEGILNDHFLTYCKLSSVLTIPLTLCWKSHQWHLNYQNKWNLLSLHLIWPLCGILQIWQFLFSLTFYYQKF